MDPTAQLALLTKAKQVFETPGHVLSFPILSPIAYSPSDLNFSDALTAPSIGRVLAEFSSFTNALPTGTIYVGDGPRLWQEYDKWLSSMVLARSNATNDQQSNYQAALALLTTVDSDGLPCDSAAVVEYKQYRDCWTLAVQSYKASQSSVVLSGDPALAEQWKETDEPRLRAIVDSAEERWGEFGHKQEVEAAQRVLATEQGNSADVAWQMWRKAFDPALDLLTDAASNLEYAPTGFAPANIATEDWPTFQLNESEITALARSAPPELRNIFADTSSATTVASVSFQFRSVGIVRPWFREDIFDSHGWRFGDGVAPLSDGGAPPNGTWPSYITGVVLARNIVVNEQSAPKVGVPIARLPMLILKSSAVISPAVTAATIHPLPTVDRPPTQLSTAAVHDAQTASALPAKVMRPIGASALSIASPGRALQLTDINRLSKAAFRVSLAASDATAIGVVSEQTDAPASGPSGSPPSNSTLNTHTTPSSAQDQISVLAFICRQLPKSPDPLPNLTW